jgi:flagellar hook-associated protein 1 FlgK
MPGTFGGLNTALTALTAQRTALDVAGQNVANANTPGYSRQRADLAAIGAPGQPALYATWQGAGGGVTVTDLARLRDAFADSRDQTEHARSGYLNGVETTLDQVEQLINEPSDSGLQAQLQSFWSAWHDVANNPGSLPVRTQMLGQAETVAVALNDSYAGIDATWFSSRGQLDALLTDINATAQSVADLNQAVVRARTSGTGGNELADRRDLLVMHLADIAGATATSQDDGAVALAIGGSTLVNGSAVRTLTTVGAAHLASAASSPVGVRWSDTGTPVAATAGQLAASLEALTSTLPSAAASLDAVAAALASTVNAVHAGGYDLNGNPGGTFFAGTGAAALTVAITDPRTVAASSTAGGSLDGTNADAMGRLATAAGGADLTYRQFVATLGATTNTAHQRTAAQTSLTTTADAAVTAASGVSLDEEMTDMLRFQRGYEAASRVLSTLDSTLDTLINHTIG